MGEVFLGIVLLAVFVPLYLRTQSLSFIAILWILLGSMLSTALPSGVTGLGGVLLALGIAVILYRLFIKEAKT